MKKFPKALNSEPGIQAVLDETRLLFQFKNATSLKEVQSLFADFGLVPETLERSKQSKSTVEVNHTDDRYWMRSKDQQPISDEQLARIETKLGSKLSWFGPVYHFTDDMGETTFIGPLPNVLLIRKKRVGELSNYIGDLHLKVNEQKSKYLNDFDYFEIPDIKKTNSYAISNQLHAASGDLAFETMPMLRDWCAVPTDTLFPQQWGMTQIQGPQAWDISTGNNTIAIAVIDSGVDLTHPDLVLFNQGIDLGDMMSDGSPNNFGGDTGHGTSCSGIVASAFNNGAGVAGIAGNCRIIPIAIRTFSNVEIANGVNWAVTQGAAAISMSFGTAVSPLISTALSNAFAANVVLCAATGNNNTGTISYPARNPSVMAIGASDQIDERKTPFSPDGENWWGSQYGAEMSVVAPGVLIPTTDMQGNQGFNPAAGAAGDYVMNFNGTSSATPHVAGLAALIKSQYPAVTSTQIRNIIERTAQKTGATPYAEVAGKPNGSWNNQLGYGRINAFRALDFANAMIRDWTGDTGVEPSTPPGNNFWSFSDIVTRFTDDNVFDPTNVLESKRVERGQTNYIYVRVTNLGPRDARNVNVNIRITPYVGLEFVYPNDWTLTDAMHVNPTAVTANFGMVAAGSSVIAKFTISAAQVEELYGWENSHPWHPCLLAQVTADNDYSYS
ncbi:MAG TPA: S8 family serine peptidase, partial [Chitinophagaceae bacterium]